MNDSLFRIRPVKRLLLSLLIFAGAALAGMVLALRFWFMPHIEDYRESIAQAASVLVGQRITIGGIAADWDGYRPRLVLDDVRLFDLSGRPILELPRVETTLSWRSLPAAGVRLYSLEFKQPNLRILRDEQGVVHVAGVALSRDDADSGFTDWLLQQGKLIIRDAQILWQDDRLGAPPLALNNVTLRIENDDNRHRFGLHASPPPALASPLEVKGDFTGDSFDPDDLHKWQGTLYAQLDYADLAAGRAWLPYPVEMQKGSGAVRLWLTLGNARIKEMTADVQLGKMRARLRPDLAELELDSLDGRLGWKTLEQGFELSVKKLRLAAQGGISLKPTDFVLRLYPATATQALHGEFEASTLELGPLTALADRLPLNSELRQRLASLTPKGDVSDVALKWSGGLPKPDNYSIKARFERLALKAYEVWPGFNNVNGGIEGNEKAGHIHLEAKSVKLDLPKVFDQVLQFDGFKALLDWKMGSGGTRLSLTDMAFANTHLSGSASGTYQAAGEGPGVIDLNARIAHVDAKQMNRYMPLRVPEKTRDWLASALSGAFNDVQLQLRGNLADFPFADESKGLFQVTAKASGVALEYSMAWPKIENLSAEMQFRGKRMEIHSNRAEILGTKLSRIEAVIPELGNNDEILQINAEAEAPAENFLGFIAHTPVNDMLGGFAENVHGSGNGTMTLKLDIPLRRRQDTKVAGTYQFNDGQLAFGPDLPTIEHMQGKLQFSELAIEAQNLNARILGGPATIGIATQPDHSVRIAAQGRINAAAMDENAALPFQAYMSGTTEWRGSLNLSKKARDVLVESNLEGLALQLPAPFGKPAKSAVPLRFEKKSIAARRERVWLSYGGILSAQLLRRVDAANYERGQIVLGGRAGFPDKNGVWVSGTLKNFNFDQWYMALAQSGNVTHLDLAGVDLNLGTVDAWGRRFGETRVNARAQAGNWKATLTGAEVSGELNWYPQGREKLVARLVTLALPDPVPEKNDSAQPKNPQGVFPALDIVVENFSLGDQRLGHLELQAVQQGRDWRIENLQLTNADSTLAADGLWLNFNAQPQTQLHLKLDVSDIGNLMAQLKLPEGIKGGTAKLEGALSWSGNPQRIDYATLSGNLEFNAGKGQFVKIDPGIAKLLGILSLQALPRRAVLDFRDIFSEGFAFDDIRSSIGISQGVITTGNFRMRGPAATVHMNGRVDLAQETQTLNVKVVPSFGDSLSLASGLLGGPIIGLTFFLVQKALKDPLGQLIAYEYNVTGTWNDPVVTRLNPPSAPPEMPLWQNN